MKFEEALKAMREGKHITRKGLEGYVCLSLIDRAAKLAPSTPHTDYKVEIEMVGLNGLCKPYKACNADILADDWIILPNPLNEYKVLSPEMFMNVKIERGELLTDEEKETLKALAKAPIEREEVNMYKNLEITFKSGETITYSEGEWDDYGYDGKAIMVKQKGALIGIYNFDDVFCVRLKEKLKVI